MDIRERIRMFFTKHCGNANRCCCRIQSTVQSKNPKLVNNEDFDRPEIKTELKTIVKNGTLFAY
jgi:hypothetical protein